MKELKTQRDVILAILAGYEIEVKDLIGGGWTTLECKSIWVNSIDDPVDKYRLKPTKPSIDWSQVSENYRYLARDEDGLIYLYEYEPELTNHDWWSVDYGTCDSAFVFKSLEAGNCDWRDSLVERPE